MNDSVANIISSRIAKYTLILASFWTLILTASLFIDMSQEESEAVLVAKSVARNEYMRDTIFRQWNASHGGVYVPITEDTPANPYLSHLENRDVTTIDGQKLTLINPAYMSRQLLSISKAEGLLSAHITSLNTIRPGNKADTWETSALKTFENGVDEVIEVTHIENEKYVRLMRPFITEQECLKCHAEQGYKVGDIRGGISISVPVAPYLVMSKGKRNYLIFGHFSLWLAGLVGLYLFAFRLLIQQKENRKTQAELARSENYYRTLLQSLRQDILVIDRNYNITDLNEVALKSINMDRDKIIGEKCYEIAQKLNFPCDLNIGQCTFNQVLSSGKYCSVHHEFRDSDCHLKNVEIIMAPVKDENGEITHVIETIRDITPLIQAQHSLRENEELLQSIAENFPNSYIAIIEKDMTISFASGQEFKKLDLDPSQYLGKNIETVFGNQTEIVTEFFERSFNGEECSFELYLVRQFQKYSCVPLFSEDNVINKILVVSENITKLKHENELRTLKLKLIEYSNAQTSSELLQNFLEEAERITDSKSSYFHFVENDERSLGLQTWSKQTMDKFSSINNLELSNPVASAGVWKNCLKERKPIIHNKESNIEEIDSESSILQAQNWLVIPVFREKKIVALFGVGNKQSHYSEDDLDTIKQLADFAWDTVVRKQAEEALKASEEFLSIVYNNSDVGIFVVNVLGPGKYELEGINPVQEKITNVKAEDVINIEIDNLSHIYEREYLNYFKNQLENCVQSKSTLESEFHIAEGEAKGWWFTRMTPIIDKNRNTVSKIIGSNVIITEIKEAEKAVQASESLLEEAQKVAKLGHYIFNIDTGIWSSSPGLNEVFGIGENYERDTNGWLDIVHPDDRNVMSIYLSDYVIKNKNRFDREYRIIDQKTGIEKWVYGQGDLKFDKNGNAVEMFGIIQDITTGKNIGEALKTSELKFRSVIEQSNDAVYIIYKNRFDLINKRFLELTGLQYEEILSEDFDFLNSVAPKHRDMVEKRIKLRQSTELPPEVYEFSLVDKEGNERQVHASVKEIDYQEGKAVLGILRDISAQKKLEDQVRQMQKVESIGQLAGGIAHDFNNLLTPIIGNAELALMTLDPEESITQDIQEISEAANRARELTRQLLAYSRKQVLEMKNVDLNKLVENLRNILRRSIREDVDIRMIYNEMDRPVQVDVSQIEQVVLNLVVNAQDAMPFGGTVTIQTESISVDQAYSDKHPGVDPGDYALLSVNDTGTGMEKSVLENIFEPFYTTKEQGKGTGLGLSTVYGIVKQHNGNIWVHSESGEGTTFKVYLPFSLENFDEQVSKISDEEDYMGSELILIVEDDLSVQKVARRILENYGYKVYVSDDGYEAISMITDSKLKIDLLVTDVIMPNLNGRELHGLMSGIFPDQKVLYMSGYTRDVIAHHGVLEEGIDFIPKPLEVIPFVKKIREILDR